MGHRLWRLTFVLAAGGVFAATDTMRAGENARFHELLATRTKATEAPAIRCPEGWLFLTAELRHASHRQFWGAAPRNVSKAMKPEWADPLPVIIDTQQQFQKEGIELIVMPVPTKVAIYPEKLDPSLALTETSPRRDEPLGQFLSELKQSGVRIVDLTPVLLKAKAKNSEKLYCQTDTHWTSAGCRLAAAELAKVIRDSKVVLPPTTASDLTESQTRMNLQGDLTSFFEAKEVPLEEVFVWKIHHRGQPTKYLADDPDSPVVLLGDSHTLVFHDPELHGPGGGLADHLGKELGRGIDVLGVRGSGGHAARISWLRRPMNLQGKKVVIWCFSARELSESPDGWRKLPITRK